MKLKIKEKREAMNWTQEQLADRSGVPQSTISSFEIGARDPKLSNILPVAVALGCTVDELIDEREMAAFKTA